VCLALGKQHPFEVLKRGIHLLKRTVHWLRLSHNIARATRVLLEDKATNKFSRDDGQELIGTRMVVRDIQSARVDEANSCRNVGTDKGGEVLQGRESNGSAGVCFDGVVRELEGDVASIGRVGKKHALTVGETGTEQERGLKLFDLRGISRGNTASCRGCRFVVLRWGDWGAESSSEERSCESESDELDHGEAFGLI